MPKCIQMSLFKEVINITYDIKSWSKVQRQNEDGLHYWAANIHATGVFCPCFVSEEISIMHPAAIDTVCGALNILGLSRSHLNCELLFVKANISVILIN